MQRYPLASTVVAFSWVAISWVSLSTSAQSVQLVRGLLPAVVREAAFFWALHHCGSEAVQERALSASVVLRLQLDESDTQLAAV